MTRYAAETSVSQDKSRPVTVIKLNDRRTAADAGMASLRCALARFEKAVETCEGNTEAWAQLQARIAAAARRV